MGVQVTTGISSGIDYEEIIQATLDVEKVPIDNLETKKEDYETTISAYGTIKSALSTLEASLSGLEDADNIFSYTATSSDEDVLSVTATEDAEEGSYQIQVLALAKANVVIGYDGFTSADTSVGTGSIRISVGGEDAVDIEIAEENDTLQNIADAINEAGVGVAAGIIETAEGQYALSLKADRYGEAISFTVTEDGDDDTSDETGLSRLYNDPISSDMLTVQEGTNALIAYGGLEIERSSNEIDGLIEGVTINLKAVAKDTWVTINIDKDDSDLADKIQLFVDNYNEVMDYFNLYQDEGDEESMGVLFGDATTRRMQTSLQQAVFTRVDSGRTHSTLSDIGVEVNDDGTLYFDTEQFEDILNSDQGAVVDVITGAASEFSRLTEAYTESDGILEIKTDGLEASVTRIEDRVEELEWQLELKEERLRTYYANLEATLTELQSTQETLESLIESLKSE